MKFTHTPFVLRELQKPFLTAVVLLGLAVSPLAGADDPGQTEALGPSSRRTPLVISEVLFAPVPRPDGRNLEFVGIYNWEPWPQDLGGYRLTGALEFPFPLGTQLAANAFVVVAKPGRRSGSINGRARATQSARGLGYRWRAGLGDRFPAQTGP